MTPKDAEPVKSKLPTITVRLDPEFHTQVLEQAKEDDRVPSIWLKRFIQQRLA